MKSKILLVDDEEDILEIVSYNLIKEGFEVITATNGINALKKAKKEKPDLILLDIMMPKMDGIEACQEIRKVEYLQHVIIVFLSARSEEFSQLAAYDAGASDYITKPIKPKILISKIKALLKLTLKEESIKTVEVKGIKIDILNHTVTYKKEVLILPKKEFDLLVLLTSSPNRVFKREEILEKVWGFDVVVGGRTIDVHIRKLRERFGNSSFLTLKGVGYKYNED